ncbi:LytTR family transcriptional regulator DNA-binding domain-containing protein [Salirhabdus salicampi]|uniref:LytTR family transcriptional regulator DNA-binding domain-containing protein n=1 Tax=Salirhabdus salicampi TaxID=476102 RepID=UPI0020C58180|nr:LytTR family transcriptional regulator DNA-binding domain-containing protein [Salirhabdus salicampi]MCP8616205.1 LytTR family transcriptional regulator DNA-binding domain-containing protein [Salirhabdus salicampi]
MTVYKELEDGSKTFTTIDLMKIDYVESENRKLVYYINGDRYFQITKLQEMESLLNEKNGFVSLDRSNLVNLQNVMEYDQEFGKIYFEENPSRKSVFATIAKMKQKLLDPLIYRAIAKNRDTQLEHGVSKHNSSSTYQPRNERI